MLNPRQRFPSRGTVAGRPATRAQMGAMVGTKSAGWGTGEMRLDEGPPQDIFAAALRQLRVSVLDVATAVRLGDTSAKPRYFGTDLPSPQALQSPNNINSDDDVNAGIINAGNAPQALNKTASKTANGAPRIARSLPSRPM